MLTSSKQIGLRHNFTRSGV